MLEPTLGRARPEPQPTARNAGPFRSGAVKLAPLRPLLGGGDREGTDPRRPHAARPARGRASSPGPSTSSRSPTGRSSSTTSRRCAGRACSRRRSRSTTRARARSWPRSATARLGSHGPLCPWRPSTGMARRARRGARVHRRRAGARRSPPTRCTGTCIHPHIATFARRPARRDGAHDLVGAPAGETGRRRLPAQRARGLDPARRPRARDRPDGRRARARRSGARPADRRRACPCHGGQDRLLEGNRRMLEQMRGRRRRLGLTRLRVPGPGAGPSDGARSSTRSSAGPRSSAPRARLSHAYVGPYTSIGDDVPDRGLADRALDRPRRRRAPPRRHPAGVERHRPRRADRPELRHADRDAPLGRRRRRGDAFLIVGAQRLARSHPRRCRNRYRRRRTTRRPPVPAAAARRVAAPERPAPKNVFAIRLPVTISVPPTSGPASQYSV